MQNTLTNQKVCFSGKNEKPFTFEFTLPEYMSGISKVLYTNVRACDCSFPSSQDEKSVSVSLAFSVIYICDFSDKIKCAYFNESVHIPLNIQGSFDMDAILLPTCFASGAAAKALSSRKVSITCTVGAGLNVICDEQNELFDEQSIPGARLLKKSTKCASKFTLCSPLFNKDCSITLGENDASIGEIVFADAYACDVSVKTEEAQADLDFTINIVCAYEKSDENAEGDSSVVVISTPIAVNEKIENPSINQSSFLYLSPEVKSISCSTSAMPYGENKSMSFDIAYEISGFGYNQEDIELATDAYIEGSDCDIQYCKTDCSSLKDSISQRMTLTEKARASASVLRDIICCVAKINTAQLEQTENTYFAICRTYVTAIGYDENGIFCAHGFPVSLHVPVGSSSEADTLPEAVICIEACRGSLFEGEYIFEFDLAVKGIHVQESTFNAVCSLCKKESPDKKAACQLVICYPSTSDNLWSVAKKYKANPDKLKEINGLEGDNISSCRMLLIP